jgi:hypothetical protein
MIRKALTIPIVLLGVGITRSYLRIFPHTEYSDVVTSQTNSSTSMSSDEQVWWHRGRSAAVEDIQASAGVSLGKPVYRPYYTKQEVSSRAGGYFYRKYSVFANRDNIKAFAQGLGLPAF